MPEYSLSLDGSIHFDFFAAQGCPDPPKYPGKQCPWDLWTIAWDLWSIVPPADIAGEVLSAAGTGDAAKSKDKSCSEAPSDDVSYIMDVPDTLVSHRSSGSEALVSSHWCLPEVVDLDCESRQKLSHLLHTMSREASHRGSRPRHRAQNMSGDRPPRWWLQVQPVPECEVVGNSFCCAAASGGALEVLVKESTRDYDAVEPSLAPEDDLCLESHRSIATCLSLPTSGAPPRGPPNTRPT